jgi:hypothetical protein
MNPMIRMGSGALSAVTSRLKPVTSAYRNTPVWRAYDAAAEAIDHWIGWDRLPTPLGLFVLLGVRNRLRQKNLYDTTGEPSTSPPKLAKPGPFAVTGRTADGSYNDLAGPAMGMAGSRFGRNVPIEATYQEPAADLLSPNPREVSRQLLTRHEFIPATSVNQLAATWIQFMIKDWFSHGEGDPQHRWEVPLAADDPWPTRPMTILKTLSDDTRPPDSSAPLSFINTETHWWDGSQVYGGSTRSTNHGNLRTGVDGKLVIGEDGLLVLPDDPRSNPALVPGWWLGLNVMVNLFVREHNAICDALRTAYPRWSDEELYHRARLINAALMARIHTVEWTPAIINHPTAVAGLRANWWGLAGERIRRAFGRISSDETVSGIPGGPTDHFGVPFALTEEFTIVYRMHPLIADDYTFRAAANDMVLAERSLRQLAGPDAQRVAAEIPLEDILYSFGTSHPGAIVLHNFPRFLQEFRRPDNEQLMDIAAIDVLRARELGVPRYNEFRRLLHLEPAASFETLTDNRAWADEMRQVYDNDIERVDLMIGMFAERRPKGFAFSDTAFRIFILMASRRLNSDRYLSADFTPEVYTPVGIEWVESNSMVDVLLRHFPQLRPSLRGISNAFQPWTRADVTTQMPAKELTGRDETPVARRPVAKRPVAPTPVVDGHRG